MNSTNLKDLKKKADAVKAMAEFATACETLGRFLISALKERASASLKFGKNEDAELMMKINLEYWDYMEGFVFSKGDWEDYEQKKMSAADVMYAIEECIWYQDFIAWWKSKDIMTTFMGYHMNRLEYHQYQKLCEKLMDSWSADGIRYGYFFGNDEFTFIYEEVKYKLYFDEVEELVDGKCSLQETIDFCKKKNDEENDSRIIVLHPAKTNRDQVDDKEIIEEVRAAQEGESYREEQETHGI